METIKQVIDRYMQCYRCGGSGRAEMDPGEYDRCYHCDRGRVDAETAREDALADVALELAAFQVEQARCGDEDFGLRAAESGLSEWDYFRVQVWSQKDSMIEDVLALSPEAQDVLIVWNAMEPEPVPHRVEAPAAQPSVASAPALDDAIPF